MIAKTRARQGRLITNGVVMEAHEYVTINVLLELGEDVELVKKSRTPHTKSPDIVMRGMDWEMKSPTGKTKRPIERIMHRAARQSENIIIDLRRTKILDKDLVTFLEKFLVKYVQYVICGLLQRKRK